MGLDLKTRAGLWGIPNSGHFWAKNSGFRIYRDFARNSEMPLLILSGYPASGKSMISNRIKAYFDERAVKVIVVGDDGVDKNIFSNFKKEKEFRSSLRSRVQAELSKDTLVICDSMNYIKGFRYELYCVAKQISTTYAVLHCKADKATCERLNGHRDENRYPDNVLNDLIRRYEWPDAKNRWDSPLFMVVVGDPHAADSRDSEDGPAFDDFTTELQKSPSGKFDLYDESTDAILPENAAISLEELFGVLIKGESLMPNVATQNLAPKVTSTFLHEMDRVTQRIVTTLMDKQRMALPGDKINMSADGQRINEILFTRPRSLPELTRIRKQFINYTKMHTVTDMNLLASLFVDFLNSNP